MMVVMEFAEVIFRRRTVRVFKPLKLTDEQVFRLLEAACYAPAGGNNANWEVIVVRDDETKRKLVKASLNQEFIGDAGAVFVFFNGKPSNVSAAIQNLLLMAHSMGLEGCWVGSFNGIKVKRILKMPVDSTVNAIVAVGVPAEDARDPGKRFPEEVVHLEEYGNRMVGVDLLNKILNQMEKKVGDFKELLRVTIEKYGLESYPVYRLEEKYAAFVFTPLLRRLAKVLRELGYRSLAERIEENVREYAKGRWRRITESNDINSGNVISWERKYSQIIYPMLIKSILEELRSRLS